MFENPDPEFRKALSGETTRAPQAESDALPASGLDALDWSQLAARLDAARELRLVLKRDALARMNDTAVSYAHEAARCFRPRNESQPDVNPVALGQCKGSQGKPHDTSSAEEANGASVVGQQGLAARSDARDD